MKILKIQVTDDDHEFNITLSSMEAIELIAMEHNSVIKFSAALLKAMDGQAHEVSHKEKVL